MKEKNVTIQKEWSLSDDETTTGMSSLPEKRSWLVRKWKWMIVCFIPVFIAGVFTIAMSAMKSSEPYKKALSLAQSNPAVKSVLGQPIEAGWFVSGSISESEAGFEIPITGNRSGGTVYVDADKHAGHWRYKSITVQPDSGEQLIDVLAGGNSMK
ncbi:cytochrome c oxidase assembly factor Coa1 family protein [Photorhabdus luminescens]|uniref:cytochrome c oxidase assembly factor Coa1 family protein n=1 Tax=Photorhabdus luminescens TaxID=29488 RepID=UPI002240AD0A|nr:cytochrome c oxidase assembly factor Coa1 family protein [Photorhabdus luminescens]MCW7764627.1 cytochrome c oxidase assembly factor 1 family protein [Photorhabdus luminescens subsp. venezuelensis]